MTIKALSIWVLKQLSKLEERNGMRKKRMEIKSTLNVKVTVNVLPEIKKSVQKMGVFVFL